MSELELLRLFFDAWEALHALGAKKKPGRPSMEHQAAAELLVQRAMAVRNFTPNLAPKPVAQAVNGAVHEYRALQQEVAAIQPKDTRRG